jgi:hypothetical protein
MMVRGIVGKSGKDGEKYKIKDNREKSGMMGRRVRLIMVRE